MTTPALHHQAGHVAGTKTAPRPPWRAATLYAVAGVALIVLASRLIDAYVEEPVRSSAGQAGSQPATQATQPTVTAPASPLVTRDEQGRLHWPRPRTTERQRERDRMVDDQIRGDSAFRAAVTSEPTLAALRAVPRHAFVPPDRQTAAYEDTPLPIGHGQTISQPYIVALMTALLELKEGGRVLEIGTGSGYQAAVLSELTPYAYTIEIVEPLATPAAAQLKQRGYATVQVRQGDGYDGWPDAAPFDAIIVTCAAGHVPPPLWDQLKPGGRMVIPIGGVYETQRLLVLTKQPDGSRRSQNVLPVRFVPMTGRIEQP